MLLVAIGPETVRLVTVNERETVSEASLVEGDSEVEKSL